MMGIALQDVTPEERAKTLDRLANNRDAFAQVAALLAAAWGCAIIHERRPADMKIRALNHLTHKGDT